MSVRNGSQPPLPEGRGDVPVGSPAAREAPLTRLVLSVAEAAAVLGISDDLVYELTERGDLPCLHLGRRKVIPTRAIDLIIDHALHGFDPAVVLSAVAARDDAPARPTRR